MKALSLTQPWATLIAVGQKRIETRDWRTDYCGELAIHAGKSFPAEDQERCFDAVFFNALDAAGYAYDRDPRYLPEQLPRGAIVAVAELVGCVKIRRHGDEEALARYREHATEHELAFGNWDVGRYLWLLSGVRALREPVPCRGYPGVWPVGDELERQIREQIRERSGSAS